ncbi:MAG: phosphatase PAP2 family protein [Solirubrobacteraceae bacterium]
MSALVCLVGLVVTGVVALLVPVAEQGDTSALDGFVALDRASPGLTRITRLAGPGPYAVYGVLLVAVGLARGRRALAAAIPVVLIGSELMTQALKQLLAHPRGADSFSRLEIAAASWPSGHATAAMAVALCAIAVAPPRARSAVALGGAAFALAVGYALVARASHFPSDVLGGYFVAGLWTSLALVAVRVEPEARAQRLGALALCGVAALAAAVVVAATEHIALALMALAMAGLALALVATISSVAAPRDR